MKLKVLQEGEETAPGVPESEAPASAERISPWANVPRPSRKQILMSLAGVLAIAAVWKAADWAMVGRFERRTDNAYIRADITIIAPKIQGYVASIAVEDNQPVAAGDLLMTLENADGAARLAEAEAALQQAKADAAQATAQLASSRAQIAAARAEYAAQSAQLKELAASSDAASANARLAASELARDKELAARGHYAKARVETAENASEAARAARTQAEAALLSQRSRITLARSGLSRASDDAAAASAALDSSKARIAAAEARLTAARLDAGRAEIRAPVAGVIAHRTVSQGQLLNPGQQAMAIVPLDKAYVIANFKETQVEKMRPGQKVEIRADAYPKLKIEGTVASLAPASGAQFSLIPQDTATGNFTKIVQRVPVRINLSEDALKSGLMRPGLSVEAIVSVKPHS